MQRILVRTVGAVLCLAGLLLMGFNIAGLFLSLRTPAFDQQFAEYVTVDAQEFQTIIAERDPSDERYIAKVNDAVYRSIASDWPVHEVEKYNLIIPPHENYILFALGHLFPQRFREYEYCDYQKAVERGLGVCSQQSIVVTEVLKQQGIDAKLLGSPQHTVVIAEVDQAKDVWWVVDPYSGIVIPHDFRAVQQHTDIAVQVYQEAGYTTERSSFMGQLYADMVIFDAWCKRRWLERISYVAIWVLPVMLIGAGILPYGLAPQLARIVRKPHQ